jgi:hypothetical protein
MANDVVQGVADTGPTNAADGGAVTGNFVCTPAKSSDVLRARSSVMDRKAPSAPAGKVCLYLTGVAGSDTAVDGEAIPGLAGSRLGFVVHAVSATTSVSGLFGTWAYTAA